MAISFDSYKIFYYAAKYQNITAAARALYLTQPTVSHAITSLEKALGCQLFIRSKKGVLMTPEAELLYEHVSQACQQLLKGEDALKRRLSMTEGLVRIGASETTLHHYLLPYLEQFKAKYPQIRLTISNTTTPSALAALKDGFIDFAVVVSPKPEEHLTIQTISFLQDVFIAGPNYAMLQGRPLHIRDLASYPFVCMDSSSGTREYMEALFLQYKSCLIPDIESATTDLITPMVAHNLGIGFVPYYFAKAALSRKEVFCLDIEDRLPARTICIVRHTHHPVSVAGNSFLQMIIP